MSVVEDKSQPEQSLEELKHNFRAGLYIEDMQIVPANIYQQLMIIQVKHLEEAGEPDRVNAPKIFRDLLNLTEEAIAAVKIRADRSFENPDLQKSLNADVGSLQLIAALFGDPVLSQFGKLPEADDMIHAKGKDGDSESDEETDEETETILQNKKKKKKKSDE